MSKSVEEIYNRVIGHAINLGLEADQFLRCWNEGDWDGCREFGFEPDVESANPIFKDELDDDHPLCLVNGQIEGLLEGDGASEDHEDVIKFFLDTGLPRSTVDRIHKAIVWGDTKVRPEMKAHLFRDMINSLRDVAIQFHAHDSLRERLRGVVDQHIQAKP